MSRDRTLKNAGFVNPSQLPKGPGGRPLCRWCGQETKPPRRTFCSDPCVREHQIRSNPGYARKLVGQRDRGVCQICRLDTAKLKRIVDALNRTVHRITGVTEEKKRRAEWRINRLRERFPWAFEKPSVYRRLSLRLHLWEMDHIVPVAEGGGSCGLENLRALCRACHLQVTRELRKRLAAKKKLP
jgi:5-methylcytosine-specific restriction protein A